MRAAGQARPSSATPSRSLAKLRAYEDAGISAFILSGYTHQAECERFGTMVLPHLDHAPL